MEEPQGKKYVERPGSFYIYLSEALFVKWRLCRLLSSSFGAAAIIPALIDYELSYTLKDRSAETCANYEITILYRCLALVLSIIALIFLIPYKVYKYRWLSNLPHTYRGYPPFNRVSILEVMEMQRKRKKLEYIKEDNIWVIVIMYLVLPYPGDNTTFTLSQQILYTKVHICYYFSEIAYSLMYLRIGYLILALFSYGQYQTNIARACAEKYCVTVSPSFSIKCYIGHRPLPILFFCFLIPGVIIFGLVMRIYERPLGRQDFDSVENAFWNVIITMSTIGYGDSYAITILGRTVVVFSIFWGGIILSLTFVTVRNALNHSRSELKAFNAISVGREAALIISNVLGKSKKETVHENLQKVRNLVKMFTKVKNSERSAEISVNYSKKNMIFIIGNTENQADNIKKKLEFLSKELDIKQ